MSPRVGALKALLLVHGDGEAFPEILKAETAFSLWLCPLGWNKTMRIALHAFSFSPQTLLSMLLSSGERFRAQVSEQEKERSKDSFTLLVTWQ